jgi:hypothetical protein
VKLYLRPGRSYSKKLDETSSSPANLCFSPTPLILILVSYQSHSNTYENLVSAFTTQVPGADSWCIEDQQALDPVSKSLREAALRAQAKDGVTLAAVKRYEVLQAAVSLLPESARLAHEKGIMSRHHTETLLPAMMKQVSYGFTVMD